MAELVQKALRTCSDHEQEEIYFYCETCKKLACIKCVKTEHKRHNWNTLKSKSRILRTKTKQEKLRMESISKSIVDGATAILDDVLNEFENEFQINCSDFDIARQKLLQYVNEEFDELKNEYTEGCKAKRGEITNRRFEIDKKNRRLQFLIREMETGASDYTDLDFVEMYEESRCLLDELQTLADLPLDFHDRMSYSPECTNKPCIKSLLGTVEKKLSSKSLVLVNQFKCNEMYKDIIRMKTANEAWVQVHDTTLLEQIDSEGNVKRTVDIKCECLDYALGFNDTIFFCNKEACCVNEIDSNGEIKTLIAFDSFEPYSICLTNTGDILVVLQRKESTVEEGPFSYHLLRMTTTGTVITDYEVEYDRLLYHHAEPQQVLEHLNGNICILILYLSEVNTIANSMVHCLNPLGMILFKYGPSVTIFDMSVQYFDICHDMKGNTLVATNRKGKREIHILLVDSKGNHFGDLFQEDSFTPGSISTIGNHLWIKSMGGLDYGVIKVYEYSI